MVRTAHLTNTYDQLRSPEIPDLRLGVLDLGRVQVVEDIERTAKVVV